jgi:hypothetical protein
LETEVLKNGPGVKAGKLGLGFASGGGEGVASNGKEFRGGDKKLVEGMVGHVGHTLMDVFRKKT